MATGPIKKVTISKKDIEAISNSGKYFFKYRITSDGNSKASSWSPIYSLNFGNAWGSGTYTSPGTVLISYNTNPSYIDISWKFLNTLSISNYDVYIAYGTTSTVNYFNYVDSTSQSSITIAKPASPTAYIKVAIFAKGTAVLDYSILRNPTYQTTFTTSPPPSFLAESAVFTL